MSLIQNFIGKKKQRQRGSSVFPLLDWFKVYGNKTKNSCISQKYESVKKKTQIKAKRVECTSNSFRFVTNKQNQKRSHICVNDICFWHFNWTFGYIICSRELNPSDYHGDSCAFIKIIHMTTACGSTVLTTTLSKFWLEGEATPRRHMPLTQKLQILIVFIPIELVKICMPWRNKWGLGNDI